MDTVYSRSTLSTRGTAALEAYNGPTVAQMRSAYMVDYTVVLNTRKRHYESWRILSYRSIKQVPKA